MGILISNSMSSDLSHISGTANFVHGAKMLELNHTEVLYDKHYIYIMILAMIFT